MSLLPCKQLDKWDSHTLAARLHCNMEMGIGFAQFFRVATTRKIDRLGDAAIEAARYSTAPSMGWLGRNKPPMDRCHIAFRAKHGRCTKIPYRSCHQRPGRRSPLRLQRQRMPSKLSRTLISRGRIQEALAFDGIADTSPASVKEWIDCHSRRQPRMLKVTCNCSTSRRSREPLLAIGI